MRTLTIALMALVALIPAALFAQATPAPVPSTLTSPVPSPVASPLSSYNLSTTASPSLATNPPPIDTVRTFISNLDTGNDEGMVCAIKFANFTNSGNLTLISGHCGSDIDIVDLTPAGFQWNVLGALQDASDDVSFGVQDLLGSGTSELVVHAYLAYPEVTGACTAVWPVVYAWSGTAYTNVSAQPQYAPYYQRQLSSLQAQFAASPSNCLQAEIDKVQRVLGNPTAGLSDATTWAASTNPADRTLAAQILGDIGTPTTVSVLQNLTGDSDPLVADIAQRFVENPSRNASVGVTPQTIPNPAALAAVSLNVTLN